jgi:hypothetical protein
VLHGKE